YSLNIMTISNLNPPYERKWVEVNEYPKATLQEMLLIKKNLFFVNDNTYLVNFIKKIDNSYNSTSSLVMINGRTQHWANSKKLIFVTYGGIPYDVDLTDIGRFARLTSSEPVYIIDKKEYVFDVTDLIRGLHESKTDNN